MTLSLWSRPSFEANDASGLRQRCERGLDRRRSDADHSDEVHARAIVALADGKPVEVQLLYPDLSIGEPLAAVAERYHLDREALLAAAQSALAAPDRVVVLQVATRTPA